ncbi:DUF547 domain-containing protein [Roseivirga misakiensis]|uniref:DUF547 domain-containing protein n=1 Tax=Roseivirga misakiensis TaxID=1563681 RepID=A0A1E5T5E5_9BACT|nr:DUF547 domain-containing protein [Roseivirga misakiensis]OEK06527.1 hypothetical protein BFP71_02325 [Roseivirga misakiensis]
MKKSIIIFIGLLFGALANAQNLDGFLDKADAFFKANVANGLVDYASIKADGKDLNGLVNQIGSFDAASLSPIERKAFFINAYNILVINGIIKEYPTKSPLEIGGFFDTKKHTIAGQQMTLNELEKDNLLKVTGDEKLHFVLVCAAISCPPIATFAYRPENLDAQILERTKMALSNDEFIQVNDDKKSVGLSEIFKWYPGDFKDKADNIIAYINQYRTNKIPSSYKTTYYTYNWTVNAQASKKDNEPTSNLQVFTPSVLLKKGQVELRSFYNIYTQNSVRNREGNSVALEDRQSFFNVQYSFNYGITKSARLNVGVDVIVSSFSDGSFLSPVFQSGDRNEVALAAFGPVVRFSPFKKLPNLSIRSAFWFPGASNLEDRNGVFVNHDRYTSFTQLFYDMELNTSWRLFLEADLLYRFARRDDQVDFFRTPLTGILSYFLPNGKASLFALYQYSPRFERLDNGFDSQFGLSQWFQQAGVGFKYQLNSKLELEASYSNFFASRNDGGGQTFNLGFRWLK